MDQERLIYPPLVAHGPDNRGAVVVVVSYSFMFITILFALLRTWSSYVQKRDLRWDDIAFTLAVVGHFKASGGIPKTDLRRNACRYSLFLKLFLQNGLWAKDWASISML